MTFKDRLTTLGPRPKEDEKAKPKASVRAATQTWEARVLDAIMAIVDPSAITAAIKDGREPATAVAMGVDPPDPLVDVLVELYKAKYSTGAQAAKAKLPAKANASAVVVASLADLVSRARTVAGGIIDTLRDRMTSNVVANLDSEASALLDILEGIATDSDRAGLIASTESQRATMAGAIDTWHAAGVEAFRWVRTSGSDLDDVCAERDGTVDDFSPDDIPVHPNCECTLEPA